MSRKMLSLILAVIVFAVFGQEMKNDFINLDDPGYVYENPHVISGLSLTNAKWAFTTTEIGLWHPLAWLSHQADAEMFALNPAGHHFTSLLLHACSTVFLFLFFVRVTGSLWKSFFVAGLFGLHPLHVESVAWAAERKDVLSGFFFMLTLLAYSRYIERTAKGRYCVVMIVYLLGLMAKPMLVTLPFLLLLLDYWPFRRLLSPPDQAKHPVSIRQAVCEKLPLMALAFAASTIAMLPYFQAKDEALTTQGLLPPLSVRLPNAALSSVRYIIKMIYPANLSLHYPYVFDLSGWGVAAACIFLLLISTFALRLAKKSPYLFVGWFWYLGMLVPVIGIVQVGNPAMADRYTYLPMIGLFVMIAWGLPPLFTAFRYRRQILLIAGILIFSVLVPRTFLRIADWRDSISIYNSSLQATPENVVLHHNLGIALAGKGRDVEAMAHYMEAIRLDPWYEKSYYCLGNLMLRQENYAEALKLYAEAARLDPNYAMTHNNAGVALTRMGRPAEAAMQFERAAHLAPQNAGIRYNLADILLRLGRTEEAARQCAAVLQLEPDNLAARQMLAYIRR